MWHDKRQGDKACLSYCTLNNVDIKAYVEDNVPTVPPDCELDSLPESCQGEVVLDPNGRYLGLITPAA